MILGDFDHQQNAGGAELSQETALMYLVTAQQIGEDRQGISQVTLCLSQRSWRAQCSCLRK